MSIETLLDDLDAKGSADAIAAFFAEAGISGLRGTPDQCPVAHYLMANGCEVKYVDPMEVEFVVEGVLYEVETPPNVDVFIGLFDEGKYPHLCD